MISNKAEQEPHEAQQSYRPQHTYEGGELACSSIALHWGLACVHTFINPICSVEKMEQLVRHSISVHMKVRPLVQQNMLFTTDITDHIGIPHKTDCMDVYIHADSGTAMQTTSEFAIVHARDLLDLMRKNSTLVLTLANHTRAVYCNPDGIFFVFDSLPAVVQSVDRSMLLTHLFQAHAFENFENNEDFVAYGVLITRSKGI